MRFAFVFALVIVVVAAIFSLQNAAVVEVVFLAWRFEGPLVLVLLLTFAAGILAGWLAAIPSTWRRSREIKQLRKDIRKDPPQTPPGDGTFTP